MPDDFENFGADESFSYPMNRTSCGFALALCLNGAVIAGYGAEPSSSAPPPAPAVQPAPSSGLLNDWLRQESPVFQVWDLGGQVRGRYEVLENGPSFEFPRRDFQAEGVDNDNSYLLFREKIHLGYKPVPWLQGYVEGRDSTSSGDDHSKNPGTDQFDLHQAYVSLGNAADFPLSLKVGRQELSYGDERLVGASDWSNVPRAFDAAKLRFENSAFWADLFGGRVVIPRDHHFNVVDDYDWFSGLYSSTKALIPWQETQLYFLARNSGVGAAATPRDIYTVGLRFKSLPKKLLGWDYALEIAKQYGNITVGGTRVDHDALAASVGGGFTWDEASVKPRLGLEYSYASGDGDSSDTENGTFENLFPTNHKHYGYMDFVGWRNVHDVRLQGSLKPFKPLTVSADYHLFWLADTHDLFYPQSGAGRQGLGYGRNSNFSSFLGSELDLDFTYNITSWAGLRSGYGHFFAGDYVSSSKSSVGGANDADWIYLQATFNF